MSGGAKVFNFKTFWRDWLIAFIPILPVLLMVYIFFIYPNLRFEMIQHDEVDELYRSLNATTLRYGLIITGVVSAFFAFICAALYDTYKTRFTEVTKVPAKLISKQINNILAPRSVIISIEFELEFELENKEIKRFNVKPDQFSMVFENNTGILTYREHSKLVFVDFDVLEING